MMGVQEVIQYHFKQKAQKIVGAKPAELEQWAHDAKVDLIANALLEAFNEGRDYENGQGIKHD